MKRAFTKMHGIGNDFVVFDATQQPLQLTPEQARRIADRHFGVGCDEILIVDPSPSADADFGYRIFNADGSESAQCGNGARCFAKFVRDRGLTTKHEIQIVTSAGPLILHMRSDGQVRVNMGAPRFEPKEIPLLATTRAASYSLEFAGQVLEFGAVSMGNPHMVLRVEDVDRALVAAWAPQLASHTRFPLGVNVGFMQVLAPDAIRLRVYERGAGETLACGSGACAAVVTGQQRGWLGRDVLVQLPGGTLRIAWDGESRPVFMTGPAVTVYEGEIEL
ncbi:MAG: diaminopimelate epimerase [Nevskiales bacterium]